MSNQKSSYGYQLGIIGLLFATFGFVTWLNGTLINFLKKVCKLDDQQSYYVASAFFAAYFFMALPSSWLLKKLGTKNGMSVGLVIMAVGALIFIPAANARSYPIFLTGLFIVGTGLALLQTAANPYVSVLGPIESAASRISIMGICNKLAGIGANLLFGSILFSNANEIDAQIALATDPSVKEQILNDLAGRLVTPYIIMAVVLLIVAFVIQRSSLPDIKEQASDDASGDTALSRGKTSIFQFPHAILGALAIFFCVGAEVMAGDLIGTYGTNLKYSDDDTKFFTSFNLVGLLLGYVTSIILIPKVIKQEKWLVICTLLGIFLTLCSCFVSPSLAIFCVAALGFANAALWPAIFPLGIRDLGKFTNIGSALLIMGIVGGAVIPPFYGYTYKHSIMGLDFRSAFLVIMTVCYAYMLWFGLMGHKIGFGKKQADYEANILDH
jgi:MFS transporter, FHS family, L-fucose permease